MAAPTPFLFCYYSFQRFLLQSAPQIVPIGFSAETALMLEELFAFFLVAIILSLMFSVKNQKTRETLDSTIVAIRAQGDRIESLIQERYQVDIAGAIRELRRARAGCLGIIIFFTSRIE
jgi:hypothetical protein